MWYQTVNVLKFPKTDSGKRLAEDLAGKTSYILTDKEECYELRAEHWHEIGGQDERFQRNEGFQAD